VPLSLCGLSYRVLTCAAIAAALTVAAFVPVAAQGGRATRPRVTPPQGPPRQVIFTYCTNCHGIDDYAYNALDRAGWNAYLTSKHRGMDVPIPAADREVLLNWLTDRFGPNTKPFPRAYVPPEITTFLSDADADTLIGRACSRCHGVERVNDGRHSAESWRVIAIDMRERGAQLTDSELERLAEWLGRVKGTNDNQ
jgi:cytochrome c553